MGIFLGLIKNNKLITYSLAVLTLLSSLYFSWANIKGGLIEEGRNQVIQEYNVRLVEQAHQNKIDTELKLVALRSSLQSQAKKEIERTLSEQSIDREVVTVTSYIDRNIYVKEECNIVDSDFVGMLNNSITSINGKF